MIRPSLEEFIAAVKELRGLLSRGSGYWIKRVDGRDMSTVELGMFRSQMHVINAYLKEGKDDEDA